MLALGSCFMTSPPVPLSWVDVLSVLSEQRRCVAPRNSARSCPDVVADAQADQSSGACQKPGMDRAHEGQVPSGIRFFRTRKPRRSTSNAPHPGQ